MNVSSTSSGNNNNDIGSENDNGCNNKWLQE